MSDEKPKSKLLFEEYKTLKDYLKELRQCQTTYLWSSITASGIILTFATKLDGNQIPNFLVQSGLFIGSIISLLIVCPLWCIWFDKASSVTRVASYVRVLEGIILYGHDNDDYKYKYIGWENSYRLYREYVCLLSDRGEVGENRVNEINNIRRAFSIKKTSLLLSEFNQPNQYNILNFCSFTFLAFTLFILLFSSFFVDVDEKYNAFLVRFLSALVALPSVAIFLFSILYSSYILIETSGDNSRSLTVREKIWKIILNSKHFYSAVNGEKISTLIYEKNKHIEGREEISDASQFCRDVHSQFLKDNNSEDEFDH